MSEPGLMPHDSNFTNPHTGRIINYYEVDIKPVDVQIYPAPMKKAKLVGYDGLIPGPTFMQEKGQEAVVRFINHGTLPNSVHLHGSYSRAPFDGYADDTTEVGGYKDYYYPNGQNARTLWYHVSITPHLANYHCLITCTGSCRRSHCPECVLWPGRILHPH